MPASWLPAALRAQAIAARTYAAFEVADSTNRVYQLCDSAACQVYVGETAEFASTNQATAATAGQIRTIHGAPAFTQYSASNGGWMSAGGEPYLVAEKDTFDPWSGNPYRSWTTKVTAAAIEKAWPSLGRLTGITIGTRDGNGLWGGRVEDDLARAYDRQPRRHRRRLPVSSRPALHLVQPVGLNHQPIDLNGRSG